MVTATFSENLGSPMFMNWTGTRPSSRLLVWGEDNAQFEMNITAWPSYHWAGQGIFGGAGSAFVGSVIWGVGMTGGIYYAGDTTYLEPKEEGSKKVDPLKEMRGHPEFNVRWIYQPGGPDERRKDMRSTHQASLHSLRTTTELFCRRI